jgi:hypothetical protein
MFEDDQFLKERNINCIFFAQEMYLLINEAPF